MSVIDQITFPFERGRHYALGELKAFEATLSQRRSECKELSNALRDAGTAWWVKLRNDELIPLEYLAAHEGLPDATSFCIMPEGSDVDIELTHDGRTMRLQVPTTGPLWTREDGSTRDWGYDQHLLMQKLNTEGWVSGWGPFAKEGEAITNRETALSTEELVVAYTDGLVRAFEKKAHLRTRNCELAVHAVGCRKLPGRMFRAIVEGAGSRVGPSRSQSKDAPKRMTALIR